MRQIYHHQSFAPNIRDLDVESTIQNSEGRIVVNADLSTLADNGRLMIDTNKRLVIKIDSKLHNLLLEDNEIKFKEI